MADLNEQVALAAEILGSLALEGRHTIATAESLTGGAVSAAITSVAGASQWFERGFVVYTARAKSEMLDVPPELIEKEGVVSLAVAHAMARGAAARSTADLSVALTGVAGPTGGTPETPVGTVCIGWGQKLFDGTVVTAARRINVPGSRATVIAGAKRVALQGLIALIKGENPAGMPCEF